MKRTSNSPSFTSWSFRRMLSLVATPVAFAMSVVVVTGPGLAKASTGDLLPVGNHHTSNVESAPRDGWLALYQRNNEWMLASGKALFRSNPNEELTEIESDLPNTVIFIRGTALNPGQVTAASTIENAIVRGQFHFRDKTYLLSSLGGESRLTTEGSAWTIPIDSYTISITWAGDLDRDGQLDILLACDRSECGWSDKLYLGGGAEMRESKTDVMVVKSHAPWDYALARLPKEGWFAVHEDANGWEVAPAQATVNAKTDTLEADVTSSIPRTKFLVRGISLKPGPLFGASKVYNVKSRIFFQGKTYLVGPTDDRGSTYSVSSAGTAWRLLDMANEFMKVHWAGDLDRDGELDLLISLGGQGGERIALYLSGDRDKNGGVRPAALRDFDE